MISVYIHIPFCFNKCKYCSFFVVPSNNQFSLQISKLKQTYVDSLLKEIKCRSNILVDKQIKTIYIWWWTPLQIWKENIFKIVDTLGEYFNLNYLEEVSIELNPDPFDEVLDFITAFNKRYKKFFRIRFSIWLQTFDDDILKKSWRNYFYNSLIWFLRDLQKIKQVNNIFNFDFIAFWTKWKNYKYKFFENFVKSHFADSFSIYMLELSPGSFWYNKKNMAKDWLNFDEDKIYDEFVYLKRVITQAGYKRYEISNYALPWRESLHNLVYWNMEDWIWLWISWVGFIKNFREKLKIDKFLPDKLNSDIKAIRIQNTFSWNKYFSWNYIWDIQYLTDYDVRYEIFMMKFRLKRGVEIDKFSDILVENIYDKIKEFEDKKLLEYNEEFNKINLTSKGMDFYNYIFTELVK